MTRFSFISTAMIAAMLCATPALARDATGTWVTQPDKKGQIAHVKASKCGEAVCGTIIKAFDASGNQITTPNVGKRVFWDMMPDGANAYEGTAYVPAHDRNYRATMKISGNEMLVRGCLGPVCQSQLWQRVN